MSILVMPIRACSRARFNSTNNMYGEIMFQENSLKPYSYGLGRKGHMSTITYGNAR